MQNTGWLSRSTKHFFTLQGAQLTIFEKVQGGSPGKMMNLLGATVTIETDKPSTTASVANSVAVEVFGRSFNSSNPMPGSHRVVVTLPKMRLWLCANSQELAKHWYRCIHLANRIRQTGKGKLALEAPLDTLTNILKQQSRRRTWDLLVLCYKTWQQRRQDVRALSQLLEAKAVRRIWQRLREVHRFYQSRPPVEPEESSEDEEKEAKRKEMHRQVLKDLRHKAVNWIQARARELYSKESHHLAGRRGPPNAMRTLRARMPVGASYEAIPHEAAMAISREGLSSSSSSKGKTLLSKSSSNSLPPCEAFLWSEADALQLHFCERLENSPGFDLMTRSVHMMEISSVILHSERVDQFNTHAGPWLTIHGPRLNLGEEPHPMKKLNGNQDALRLTIAVRSGRVMKPKLGSCTRAYLSLLGQRIASSIQTEEEVDYTSALDRWIPLPPVDTAERESFLKILEDAVCSLDIVQELHPDLVDPHRRFHPRVLCGNRLALWRLLSETEELPKEKGSIGTSAFAEMIEKVRKMSMSWRIPLLRYGQPEDETPQDLYLDLEVKAEYISKTISRPRLVALDSDAYVVRLQERSGLFEVLELEVAAVRNCELREGFHYHIELDVEGSLQATRPVIPKTGAEKLRRNQMIHLEGCRFLFPRNGDVTLRLLRRAERSQDLDWRNVLAGRRPGGFQSAATCIYETKLNGVAHRKEKVFEWIEWPVIEATGPLSPGASPSERRPAVHVALTMPSPQATSQMLPRRPSIGDVAILPVEEVLIYPKSEKEFKDLLLPGRFDPSRAGTVGVPLRLPRTMVELVYSGLPDRKKGGPSMANCLRVPPPDFELWPNPSRVPVRFAIADDETDSDLRRRQVPANLRRAREAEVGEGPERTAAGARIVYNLTHALRQVSVQVISMNSDGFCDVEVSQSFVKSWEALPTKRYCLPGHPCVVGEPHRLLLKGVPFEILQVEQPGFHVFDAMIVQSEDAIMASNRRSSCGIVAGPVPWDVLEDAGCRYAWTLHLRVDGEEELHRLVLNLRQLVRLKQMEAVQLARGGMMEESNMNLGQLEVLLVEAKNLFPRRRHGGASAAPQDVLDAVIGGQPVMEVMKEVILHQDRQELFVRLRMTRGNKAFPINGQLHFDSPISKDARRPWWSSTTDGWAFSMVFQADAFLGRQGMPDLFLELEVMNLELAGETSIGKVRIPVTKEQFLTNPEVPFRNLWLPLAVEIDGKWIVTQCGDLHIMTLWRPLPRVAAVPGCAAGVHSCSSCMDYLKESVRRQLRSMEPLPLPGVGHLSRNDLNLLLEGRQFLSSEGEALKLMMTLSRRACVEQRSLRAWSSYLQQMSSEASLAEMRLYWTEQKEEEELNGLKALLQLGVAERLRPQIWLDLSMGRRCCEKLSAVGASYISFREAGKRFLGPTVQQLQEDTSTLGVHFSTADSSRERKLLHQAKNVCSAFIGFTPPSSEGSSLESGPGLGYCESLLAIAFHMLAGCDEATFREEEVFWILHALGNSSANGAYRDYFEKCPASRRGHLVFSQGPAEDALLLDCALAVHEPELRVRLAALGMPAGALFWAPFQRLFAGVLLSHPLRRFWDVLIAESSDVHAHPHPRHVLVDLAFGVLQGLKDRLLLAQSPEAVQELFSTFMLELSDPEDLLDLLFHAEALLWQGFRRHEVLRLWDVTCSKFARFLWRYGQQDDLVLRQLVTLDPFASDLTMGPSWLTPDFILNKVLPELKEALPHIMATSNPPCGLPRQVPEALLELMFVESANQGFSLASLVGASWTEEEELGLSGTTISLVHPIDLAPSQLLSAERWAEILKAKLPGWLGKSQEIFDAFRCESPLSAEDQSHICFNEFIAALICCSQGTAGDKARALFDLCAEERMGQPELPHRIPLSHVVIQREEPDTLQMGPTAVSSVTPTGTHVLEIEVWGNEYGQRAGYVFVDSLRPFTTTSYKGDEELRRQGLPFVVWSDPSPAARRVGEVRLGISWTPRNPQTADVGTLSLCIRRLQLFDWSYDTALETMPRPWLQARASDKDGVKRPILLQGKLAFAQMDGLLRSWAHQASQSMTWTSKEATLNDDQSWSWAQDVMQSASNLRFRAMSSAASKGSTSTSTISLFRCRQLAECLVRRSGLYLTQRQVWQLADQCFQRSGGSRTILDALLLAGVEPAPDVMSGSQVRKMCQESGRDYVDITALVLREMEKSLGANTIELGKLCLEQFFPGVNTFWILLPGTEAEAKVVQTWDPNLPTETEPIQLTVDLAESELNAEVLTKDEFVSCVLAHPTLSEALKRRQPELLVMDAMRTLTLDVILELNPSPVDTDVVPRYLPLLFGETPGSASGGRCEGAGHGIKVFLTDSMWDFLEKVQDACQQLAKLPAKAGSEVSKRYASVKLGLDYEVFAFVPQSLAANPKESLQDLVRAHADASSWLILNKDCTLESYAGILYQQPNMLPCLKVSKR